MAMNPHISAFFRRTLARPVVHPAASRFLSTTAGAVVVPTIVPRRSKERGHANHGWLNTYHTFNFADYYDPKFPGFGCLRVINEDTLKPGYGFGQHPHKVFEIFSYILSGELEHKDSMGNTEILRRGDIQFTSAGTGITHSEHNASKSHQNGTLVHFLQIWVQPDAAGAAMQPEYHTKHFSDATKLNTLRKLISPASPSVHDPATIGIHNDFYMYAGLLEPGNKVTYKVNENLETEKGNGPRSLYIHVANIEGQVTVKADGGASGELKETLFPGDGAFVKDVRPGDEVIFSSKGRKNVEFVVFDLANVE